MIRLALFTILMLSMGLSSIPEKAVDMEKVETGINEMRAITEISNLMQTDRLKILSVINRYNPNMVPEIKDIIIREIINMATKYDNLDIDFICALITHESALTWNPEVVSPVGARGLMQIMPGTARLILKDKYFDIKLLYDPIVNIRLGCRLLSHLIARYGIDAGLAAYNGGERRACKFLQSGKDYSLLAEETRDYIPAVIKHYNDIRNAK